MKNILPGVVLMLTIALLSCEKIIGPENDNHSGVQRLYKDAAFAEGLLLNGYAGMPNSYIFDEIATDDAANPDKTLSASEPVILNGKT
jgi:starch-binding outer membrane protein, SusD/RagB family